MENFDHVWEKIHQKVQPGSHIPDWTALKGYLGKTIEVISLSENGVRVRALHKKSIVYVPKNDFKIIWNIWSKYLRQEIRRHEIMDMIRTSVYVISILKFVD